MKIRLGLVSNSSTSSFICYTKNLAEEAREKIYQLATKHNEKVYEGYLFLNTEKGFVFGQLSNHEEELINYLSDNIPDEYWDCNC